uniref:Uncharacterized protein n=1 Tax=Anguilla anguilla TaxID=7936 RepID=A0A0E9Q9I8_ANGAN
MGSIIAPLRTSYVMFGIYNSDTTRRIKGS